MTFIAFLEGFIIGVGTIIFIGPVLFTLLQITLHRGYHAGLSVALGIIASDVLILGLFYIGLIDFFHHPDVQFWMAVFGSIILLSLGIKYIIKPYSTVNDPSLPNLTKNSNSFMKGFLVNFINPFVFVVWISIITHAENRFEFNAHVGVFLLAVLVGIFTTDVIKVMLAGKLHSLLKPGLLRKIFFSIGLVLIGFGFRLIHFIATR